MKNDEPGPHTRRPKWSSPSTTATISSSACACVLISRPGSSWISNSWSLPGHAVVQADRRVGDLGRGELLLQRIGIDVDGLHEVRGAGIEEPDRRHCELRSDTMRAIHASRAYSARMRHAVYVPPFGTFGDVNLLVDLARAAEQAGWDGFFLWDHLLYADDVPFVDAWIALAAIAAATERIRLGPLITPLPRRRPWKVAREAVTLDHLSGGRLVLGVGLGIDFWREFGGFAARPPTTRTRRAPRRRHRDHQAAVVGRARDLRGPACASTACGSCPRPLQQPRIPIWSAVLWPPRPNPMRRAARCDGVVPFGPTDPHARQRARAPRRDRTRPRRRDARSTSACTARRARRRRSRPPGVDVVHGVVLPEQPLAEVRRIIEARSAAHTGPV